MIKVIQADITTLAVDAIVNAFLATHPEMEVTFCCFSKWDKEAYERLTQEEG